MIDYISRTLPVEYGLYVDGVNEVAGGWSASAFDATTQKGRYFVKVYDKQRASVRPWIRRMEYYMPAVLWMSDNTPLAGRMAAPVLTKHAAYKVENAEFVLVVFPYVEGETLRDKELTSEQIRELAETLAMLHVYSEDIPVPTEALRETYALPFLDSLDTMIQAEDIPSVLREIMQVHAQNIQRSSVSLRVMAEQMRSASPRYVLCHTDVHGWNMIWGERLVLIDWEGLCLAPVESDLFVFTEGFFFDYAESAFFTSYRKVCPAYIENDTAMHFYRLRRRMEDISEFCDSIMNDGLPQAELEQALTHLRQQCEAVGDVMECTGGMNKTNAGE